MTGCFVPSVCRRTRFVAAATLLLCGCSREIVPVSGRVTKDGKPLSDAVVTFQPLADQKTGRPAATGSVGRTDAEGRFTLRLIDPDRPGALIGDHVVTISAAKEEADADRATERLLPSAWSDGSKRFKVPQRGTSEANFEITGR